MPWFLIRKILNETRQNLLQWVQILPHDSHRSVSTPISVFAKDNSRGIKEFLNIPSWYFPGREKKKAIIYLIFREESIYKVKSDTAEAAKRFQLSKKKKDPRKNRKRKEASVTRREGNSEREGEECCYLLAVTEKFNHFEFSEKENIKLEGSKTRMR